MLVTNTPAIVCPPDTQSCFLKIFIIWDSVILLKKSREFAENVGECFIVSNTNCGCENSIHPLLTNIQSRQLVWYWRCIKGGWSRGFTETLNNSIFWLGSMKLQIYFYDALFLLWSIKSYSAITLAFPMCFSKHQKALSQIQPFGLSHSWDK